MESLYPFISWTRPRCRYDFANLSAFSMAPDLLFDFAVTFTVSPGDPERRTLESAMRDLFRSCLDAS